MQMNQSVEHYQRFLQEKYTAFRRTLKTFLTAVTQDDADAKRGTAAAAVASLQALKEAMAVADYPSWVTPVQQILDWYLANQSHAEAGYHVVTTIMANEDAMTNQGWEYISAPTTTVIDFSAIYDMYFRSSRVPDLFDELIAELEEVIASGEVDSVKTLRALETLVETIRRNSRVDLFTAKGGWIFAETFLRHSLLEVLDAIPGINRFVKALRGTMDELGLEMTDVQAQVNAKVLASVNDVFPTMGFDPVALPPAGNAAAPTAMDDVDDVVEVTV